MWKFYETQISVSNKADGLVICGCPHAAMAEASHGLQSLNYFLTPRGKLNMVLPKEDSIN